MRTRWWPPAIGELIDADSEQVYAFTPHARRRTTAGHGEHDRRRNRRARRVRRPAAGRSHADAVAIGTYDAPAGDGYDVAHAVASLKAGTLAPWEGIVVRI